MDNFLGTFDLIENRNWEEFLKALGTNIVLRQLAKMFQSNTLIHEKIDKDKYRFKSQSTVKNSGMVFRLNEEFEEVLPSGEKRHSILTLDESTGVLKHVSKGAPPSGKDITLLRVMTENGKVLIIELKCDNVKCVRMYRKRAS